MNPRILIGRFIWIAAILILVPAVLALSGMKLDGAIVILFAFMLLLIGVVFLFVSRLVRLAVSEDGVQFRAPGVTITTTWDNIDSIGTRIVYGEGSVEGLVLRQRGMEAAAAVRATQWFNFASWYTLRTYEDFLPISSVLGKDWRDTEFGLELRRRVPRLFAAESA